MTSAFSPSRVAINVAVILAMLGLAWLFIQIRSTIFLFLLGIVFAAAIEPIVFRLRRGGLGRGQSILVVYAFLIALLVGGLYLLVPLLADQFSELDRAIPDIFQNLKEQALQNNNSVIRNSGYHALSRIETEYMKFRNSPEIGGDQAVGAATTLMGGLLAIVSLMIIAFYWMTEKASIKRVSLGLFPMNRRARAHAIWDEIEFRIGGWTRGQLLLMLIIGLCSGVAYYFIDLRFWLALAIWAGITEAIPFIGPFIGGGTAALIALADSPQKAGMVVIFAFLLQQLEGAFLVPRVMRNAVGMSPLTVVLAVLIGNSLLGPIGSLLAIPVGAAVQVLVGNLLRLQDDRISSELYSMDVAPLSADKIGSPFVPKRSSIPRFRPDHGSNVSKQQPSGSGTPGT